MMTKNSQKSFQGLKKIIESKPKVDNYHQKIVKLGEMQLLSFLKSCRDHESDLILKKGKYKIFFDFEDPQYKTKPFILFLTKKQIKDYNFAKENGGFYNLLMSKNQFTKTCYEVAIIKRDIYYYLEYRKLPPKPKKKEILAITYEVGDLIDFSDDEEKDLIDLRTEIPNLIKTPKKPTAQELLIDEELFPKGKKYKVLQDEDLIPTSTSPSTDGVNILKNILNYPATKNILGLSLTPDLKEKINKLDSEASFGVANIISSLITNNHGKMSVYSVTRKQLKEIIEGVITTLSVLLNPAQKF